MTNLRRSFSTLDRIEMPDVWRQVEAIGPRPPSEPRPATRSRVVVAIAALLIAGVGIALVASSLSRSPSPSSSPFPSPSPVLNASNGKIAFVEGCRECGNPVHGGPPMHTRILTMNPDGSSVELLRDVPGYAGGLAWSPDGQRLLFEATRDAFTTTVLYLMNADGTGVREIPVCKGRGCDGGASWSPDGSQIAFVGGLNIFVADADGSGVRALTHCHPAGRTHHPPGSCYIIDGGPTWSPDGSQIAFAQETFRGEGGIFIMRTDGSDLHRITSCASRLCLGGLRDGSPAWSPDGAEIAFTRERNIWVMGPDGSGVRRLTSCRPTYRPKGCDAAEPVWAPDGSQIAFDAEGRIQVVEPDGSHVRDIGPRFAGGPAWQARQ
jgi:Tol biopolymer transport system component